MGAISNLWHGRIGLAQAYWLWGIVGGALWGIPLALVTPGSASAIVIVFAFMAYYVIVNTGVWRSASAYAGPKVWAILAHIGAALGFVTIALMVLAMLMGGASAVREHFMGPSVTKEAPIDWEKGTMTAPSTPQQ